jgi:hypothetical protein
MRKVSYLSMDVHARNTVMGDMNGNGKFLGTRLRGRSRFVAARRVQRIRIHLFSDFCFLSSVFRFLLSVLCFLNLTPET